MTEPTQEQIKSLEERLAQEPQSPLFARLAAYYLSTRRTKDALRLCDNGLAHFPFYSTAHLIKGNVLASLGMMAEAKHEYEVVREFMPTSERATLLWSSIDLGTPSDSPSVPDIEESVEAATVVAEPEPIPLVEAEPAVEESVEPEPPAPVAEELVHEEAAPQEEFAAVVEEPPIQETVTEEPPPTDQVETPAVADDAFGLPVEPAAKDEEPVGAAEKLGLSMAEEPHLPAVSEFGTAAEQAPPAVEETPFGETAEQAQVVEETPFGETAEQEPQTVVEDSFGQVPEAPAETAAPEIAEPAAEAPATESPVVEQPEWFDAFSQLQQTAEETPAAPGPAEEDPFAAFGSEQPTPPADAETYEDFTAHIRMELFGTENTMSLEDYLGSTPPPGTAAAAPDQIGELAEKLKTSPRITPPVINFAEKSNRTSGDIEAVSDSGFVTPTLAEIYVKQGWYDDAIKAYTILAGNKPEEKEKYARRIAEIEELKRSSK